MDEEDRERWDEIRGMLRFRRKKEEGIKAE